MFFKGVIFDLDDTICNYEESHNESLSQIIEEISINFKINKNLVSTTLNSEKIIFKNEVGQTASSHNKFIYFKKLFEKLNLPLEKIIDYYNKYSQYFFKNLHLIEGVKDLILFFYNQGIKLSLLTDYTSKEQIVKLKHLDILKYFDHIICSEELGQEKPSLKMFLYALYKLNLKQDEVIMIGNDFKKDICGSTNLDIYSFYFDPYNDFKFYLKLCVFNNFKTLYNFFVSLNDDLQKFEKISKYCGERFDLVQAGGGNISFKINDLLFIKSSGINLCNISINEGYSVINNELLIKNLNFEESLVNNKKPSIETYMHSILKKWTIHLHPIQINKILIKKDCEDILKNICKDFLIINYAKPGLDLYKEINKNYKGEEIIFLKNHGVIFTSDSLDTIYYYLEDIINRFEKYINLDYSKYKDVNYISYLLNNITNQNNISYLTSKIDLNFWKITNPDFIVYCGLKPLILDNLHKNEVETYFKKYNYYPTIIQYKNNTYIYTKNINKCRDIESVLLANLEILDQNINLYELNTDETIEILEWEDEKYRLKL